MTFLTAEQEKNITIAPSDTIVKKDNNTTYLKKKQKFIKDYVKKAKLISTSRNQIMSIGTGLIPFLEHNDANRALMGSNMQRQALPLKYKETPLLETGVEKQIIKTSQMIRTAKNSGFIIFVSKKKIIAQKIKGKIKYKDNKTLKLKYKKKIKDRLKSLNYMKDNYIIENSRKSNQNTFLNQLVIIKQKEWIKKGQILTDGSGTLLGKLSIGKNILIAYMSWEGYNFEDAIVINKRLVDNDIFTSVHSKKKKIFFSDKEKEEVRIRD